MAELTPAQKREQTLKNKYGDNWRQVVGQKAKKAREAKHGKEIYSRAGRKGGASGKPENRPFSKDHTLAKKAGVKGAAARWGKHES